MFKIRRKNIELAVVFGLICAMLLSLSRFDAACDELRGNLLRLHILANSDSAADQQVKLAVRDRILEAANDIFSEDADLDGALLTAGRSLDEFTDIANGVLKEYGFDYTAEAEIGDSYFETREYEDFTLPAGTYRSLIIRLGAAQGKNWWCVVFPAVCLPAAEDAALGDAVSDTSALMAEHPQRYIMRFKTVEWYEEIKKFFKG